MNNTKKRFKLTVKNAVILLIILGSVLAAAVILLGSGGFGFREIINAGSVEGREKYLNSLGWEIDPSTETSQSILIPRELDGVLEEYAKMQDKQGYDFSVCRGVECTQYTYVVTNYPEYSGTVYAVLYVRSNRVLGGDIHAAELGGFMHGLR